MTSFFPLFKNGFLDLAGDLRKLAMCALWSCMSLWSCMFLCSAGILRYRVDFQGMDYLGEDDEFFDLDDY